LTREGTNTTHRGTKIGNKTTKLSDGIDKMQTH
jgi:hypothetical protein